VIQPAGRESKAIPIVAPPKTANSTSSASTHSLTKENLLNNNSETITRKVAGPSSSSTSSAPPIVVAATAAADKEVEALLISFEGKPIHEKKQLLGDKLFPLVKVKLFSNVFLRVIVLINYNQIVYRYKTSTQSNHLSIGYCGFARISTYHV
jgi:hypothetical protein